MPRGGVRPGEGVESPNSGWYLPAGRGPNIPPPPLPFQRRPGDRLAGILCHKFEGVGYDVRAREGGRPACWPLRAPLAGVNETRILVIPWGPPRETGGVESGHVA